MITFYKSMMDNKPFQANIDTAIHRIKSEQNKDIVSKVRSGEVDKTKLPCVVFAGVIESNKRKDDNVVQHSGYFVLDFDKVDPKLKKQQLSTDSYIYSAWVSPSGNGVKALVKCPPNIENHSLYYNAMLSRYPELDPTGKNISRLCFESYDPDLYINEGSLTWDKTLTDEQLDDFKSKKTDKRKQKVLDITTSMISVTRPGKDGGKHETLLNASNLLGGYVAVGVLTEKEAFNHLLKEITKKKPDNISLAKKTIKDGLENGKSRPLNEVKELERTVDFTRRSDGDYDFMADESDMDEYEWGFINGCLEMGLPTGMPKLDQHYVFKKNTLVWLAARDNVGKSYIVWYFSVLVALLHDWKFLVYSKENRDGQVRKKIKEFYIGKSIKLFNLDDHKLSKQFVKDHFKFMTAKKMHTVDSFLMKCEVVYDEGWEYDAVIGDPFNAFDVPPGENAYSLNLRSLNQLQTFKENYSSVWITDHITSNAARENVGGQMTVPTKHHVEGGQMKPNKADDFLIAHRDYKSDTRWMITEIHVDKIKDTETGGKHTPKENPVELLANKDLCGYTCDGVDPVREHWVKKNGAPMYEPEPTEVSNRMPKWESEKAPF